MVFSAVIGDGAVEVECGRVELGGKLSTIRGPGQEWVPRNSSEPGRIVGNFPALGMACGWRFALASGEFVGKAQGRVSRTSLYPGSWSGIPLESSFERLRPCGEVPRSGHRF